MAKGKKRYGNDNSNSKKEKSMSRKDKEEMGDLTLTSDDVPQVENWEKGENYRVTLNLKQVSGVKGEGEESNAKFMVKGVEEAGKMDQKEGRQMEKGDEESIQDVFTA